jgi:hypothetical protein
MIQFKRETCGCQLGIHRILDAGVPEGVRWLDFLPRIGLVLREIGLVIKIGKTHRSTSRTSRLHHLLEDDASRND